MADSTVEACIHFLYWLDLQGFVWILEINGLWPEVLFFIFILFFLLFIYFFFFYSNVPSELIWDAFLCHEF